MDWAIKKLDLTRHEDQPVQDLSGGNRRKLSVAIALVGDPPVVLLDEPTTGKQNQLNQFLRRNINVDSQSCVLIKTYNCQCKTEPFHQVLISWLLCRHRQL